MSRTPEIPEHLKPLAQGYTQRQVAIDAEMVTLGRPALSSRELFKTLLDPKALHAHRAVVEAWEYANPEAAARWLELRADARAEDERLYAETYGAEAYARERMRRAGFDEQLIARATGKEGLRDSACFTAARDWAIDGTQWSLTFIGPPGCGKSQASTWAAFQLLTRNGFVPRCVPCRRASEAPLYGMEAEEYRWRCRMAPLLVLDDLGEGEQMKPARSAWRGWVDEVLSERYTHKRKTIITTNRPVSELAAWLSAGIVDRLNEGAIVSTREPSLRQQPNPKHGGRT